MTSVRQAGEAVNANAPQEAPTPPAFRPRFADATSKDRHDTGPGRQEPAAGKNFPKRLPRYGFAVRNRSSAAVSSAGFSTGSSWPASMMRTTASGYALAIRSIWCTGSWMSW